MIQIVVASNSCDIVVKSPKFPSKSFCETPTYGSSDFDLFGDHSGSLLDAGVKSDGVDTRGDGPNTIVDDGLGHDRRGGGTIAGLGVGLGGDLLDELGADILLGILEADLTSDGDAIVDNFGGAVVALQDDVATLRTERYLHSIGDLVDAINEGLARLLLEADLLGLKADRRTGKGGSVGNGSEGRCRRNQKQRGGDRKLHN